MGRHPALPCADLHPDAPSAAADRNAGRHDLPFRLRRHRRGPAEGRAAAGAKDIKIGGGVETVRQYIQAGHVDEIHLAMAPVAIGRGEALFSGLDLRGLWYRTVEHVPTARPMHIVLAKRQRWGRATGVALYVILSGAKDLALQREHSGLTSRPSLRSGRRGCSRSEADRRLRAAAQS